MKGVLLYCFNTEFYRYDKIAAKTVPLLKKNLKLPITIVTNYDTFKLLPPLGMVNYILTDHETGNYINRKPWHNLDRHRAYELSPYDKTILLDIDYFCFTDYLLTLADADNDFLVHQDVHDLTGKGSYKFRQNSMIQMVWATVIVFAKTDRAKAIFDMVRHIKENYSYYTELYRINFRNFRNDYAFAIALHQLGGHQNYDVIPAKLPTLPGVAKVLGINNDEITWQVEDNIGKTSGTDVHVIDKGVQNV